MRLIKIIYIIQSLTTTMLINFQIEIIILFYSMYITNAYNWTPVASACSHIFWRFKFSIIIIKLKLFSYKNRILFCLFWKICSKSNKNYGSDQWCCEYSFNCATHLDFTQCIKMYCPVTYPVRNYYKIFRTLNVAPTVA